MHTFHPPTRRSIHLFPLASLLALWLTATAPARADAPAGPAKKVAIDAPHGLKVSVKMIGPAGQATDLQVICVLKHDPAPGADKYAGAMTELNDRLGGMLASLRERGEFAGDLGETLLFTPPTGTIAPKRMLLVGVGPEAGLTVDTLRLVGRIAARETVRLGVAHASFAPALRDQGSTRVDVGEGDGAMVEQFVLAYDTERRLQAQGLAPKAEVTSLTIEAGPSYFEAAAAKVKAAVAAAAAQVQSRSSANLAKEAPRAH